MMLNCMSPLKTNQKMQSISTPTLFMCVWFVTPDYCKKSSGLLFKKLRCTVDVMYSAPTVLPFRLASATLLMKESYP